VDKHHLSDMIIHP